MALTNSYRFVGADGDFSGMSQRAELNLSSRSLGTGDDRDQSKGDGVDSSLQGHERLPDGLEEGDQTEEAVLADHHLQQLLMHFDKLDERGHHELGVSVGELRRVRRHLCHVLVDSAGDGPEVLSYPVSIKGRIEFVDLRSCITGVAGQGGHMLEKSHDSGRLRRLSQRATRSVA